MKFPPPKKKQLSFHFDETVAEVGIIVVIVFLLTGIIYIVAS